MVSNIPRVFTIGTRAPHCIVEKESFEYYFNSIEFTFVGRLRKLSYQPTRVLGCLPFDTKIWLGCQKHIGKHFTRFSQNFHIHIRSVSKNGTNLCGASLEARRNGEKQHSILFVPTEMNNMLHYFCMSFK